MAKILTIVIIVASVLGLMNAGYISWNSVTGTIPPCRPPFACDEVLSSSWAKIGPLPLSFLGVIFYGVFLVLGSLHLLGKEQLHWGARNVQLVTVIALWGLVGFLFSLYLITIMGVILQAWCLYCLLSAFDALVLFIASVGLYAGRKQ